MSRHVKSRSGCRVCKAKRLKCDETVPACRNCVNRGIACPGYRQVLRWSTKYENPATSAGFPQFSQLASAASQSIKPEGRPGAKPATPAAGRPAVKTEKLARQGLSQLPPAPLSSSSSYGPDPPPPIAKTPDSTPPPFSVPIASLSPSPSLITSTTTLIPTGRQDWQLAPYGDVLSMPISVDDADADEAAAADDDRFTLELWQPERLPLEHQRQLQLQLQQQQHPVRGLALPGTSLVELWFKSVCGMWAALDSPTNPFRRLCSTLWSSNEAVFFSMQTMAAASLPRRPPSVSEIVMLAPQMSTQALIHELQDLFGPDGGGGGPDGGGSPGSSPEVGGGGSVGGGTVGGGGGGHHRPFPAGLLTSLFCMSSSLSWIDARQLGIQYLRNARSVIDLLDLRAAQLSADDRELLEFFRGCLLYEEMLRSIVTDDQEDIQALLDWTPPAPGGVGGADLDLHAWAGVPIVLIGLFGKVMALCRRSRKVWRKTARATYQLLYQAMQDIQEGQALEEMLLSIEIPQAAGSPSGCGGGGGGATSSSSSSDDPLETHIYKAAEVFRLLALLQLYQTFPDLVSRHHQPALAETAGDQGPAAVGRWLMPLVLHIIDLLGEIPHDSPMRCLQPLLCLCAGSALRLDMSVGYAGSPPTDGTVASVMPLRSSDIWTGPAAIDNAMALPAPAVEPSVVRVARDALRQRLVKLEQNLPPRPITVARQLLETVWLTYDTEVAPSRSHWLDIMAETNFESVFG